MSSAILPTTEAAAISQRIASAVAMIAGRLARVLAQLSPEPGEPAAQSHAFLWNCYESATQGAPVESSGLRHPIDRLASRFGLSPVEVDLLLFAGMPDEHEGYAAVLRSLHPRGESRSSSGLAAQVLFPQADGRRLFRALVEDGPLFRRGILLLSGDAPLFDRSIIPASGLWPGLHGLTGWPVEIAPLEVDASSQGLGRWLAGSAARRAMEALSRGETCTVAVTGDDVPGAFHRALALVAEAGCRPLPLSPPAAIDIPWYRLLEIHAALHDAVPVLRWMPPEGPSGPDELAGLAGSGPLVLAATNLPAVFARGRSMIPIPMEPLTPLDRRAAWLGIVPSLAGSADRLASRYPLEPFRIAETGHDLRLVETLDNRPPTLADVAQSLRARAHYPLHAGVKLVHPRAGWEDLVLSPDLIAQLQEAVDRLVLQCCVLDDWGFLRNRTGTRGVRLLFAGPPGTGKTLSAEVLANALNADLLVVDVSRVVSKWVGETEKNLATVFDAAESSQAVLLFDEADALFARRTEVSDAHDRYANLETAYLLQRLERFEGLAILASNHRHNIDAAFVRRLEFVLEFGEPNREQREALWKRHVPAGVPTDRNLNYQELAALYPVVGGVIRNAAVAAAFRAAADGLVLSREHFIHAIRREYCKAGKAFPGLPPGMKT